MTQRSLWLIPATLLLGIFAGLIQARRTYAQDGMSQRKIMEFDLINQGIVDSEHSRRPNVIILFIDDLGYGDIGAFGGTDIPTPNIDLLANQGVRCTMAYTICPVCSPSRVALMTGMYPQRFGVFGNQDRGTPIPEDHPTMAEFMRNAGYITGMVGRWDIGEPDQGPLNEGFMEVARSSGPADPSKRALPVGPTYLLKDGEYLTDQQGDQLVDFVTRHREEPFFLYFAPLAIHYPVQEAPEKYLERVPGLITDDHRRNLAATLIAADDAIGKLMQAIHTLGLDEQTIIFFTGDNGGQERDLEKKKKSTNPTTYGGSSNHPYRGGKGTPWDGAVHEPFIVRWTGHLPAGKTFDGLLSTLDIYATAAVLAGKKAPPACDGSDMIPYLTGARTGDIHESLYWYWMEGDREFVQSMRKGKWRLMRISEDDAWQLYDIISDPGETRNKADDYPEVTEKLSGNYKKWLNTLPAAFPNVKKQGGRMPAAGKGWATPENP